jgi:nucleotide-binding universal stress UspA family protein
MSDRIAMAAIGPILTATDFAPSSELAFVHALKIALAGKAKLYGLHADLDSAEEVDGSAFLGARRTFAKSSGRPEGSPMADVGDKLGIRLAKISAPDHDPRQAIARFLDDHKNDLTLHATHGREGVPRSVVQPAARETVLRHAPCPVGALPAD